MEVASSRLQAAQSLGGWKGGEKGGKGKEKRERGVQVWAGKCALSLARPEGCSCRGRQGRSSKKKKKLNMKSRHDPVIPLLLTNPKEPR